jgi:MFS family permease
MDVVDRWERWAPISGIVFALAFLTLFFLFFVPGELPADADAARIADYYKGRGPAAYLLMYALIGISGVALLWFSGSLRASLRREEPAPGRLSAAALGGGVAAAILLLAGGATLLAPFTVVIFNSTDALDPTLYAVLSAMGFIAINFGLLGGALMVVATSLVALRWGGLPAWFGWVGVVVALALALNILYFFGFFIWVGWLLLASTLQLARPADKTRLRDRRAVEAPSPPTATNPAG